MQLPSKNRYLLSIYAKLVLKVFKPFKSLRVSSLSVGFWGFNISCLLN